MKAAAAAPTEKKTPPVTTDTPVVSAQKTAAPAATTASDVGHGDYKRLFLSQLRESKTNPRTTFDAGYLNELADSIKHVGVVSPILVREIGTENGLPVYETVFGACRSRGSKIAGVDDIPAVVRKLTDAQVIAIQLIENLQRKDIHPLDEARAFARLTDKKVMGSEVMTAEQIAEKIGKSVEYVYARAKLNKLSDKATDVFQKENLPVEHAVTIARLNEGDQHRAIKWCLSERQHNGSFPTVTNIRHYVDEEIKTAELRQKIADKLAEAKANKERAVPISTWQSWYGNINGVIQTKGTVFSDQYRSAESKACDDTAIGVCVDRTKAGETTRVCANQKCKTHWFQPKANKKKQKGATKHGGGDTTPAELHHQARDMAENRAIGLVRTKTKHSVDDLRFIAYALTGNIDTDHEDAITVRHKAATLGKIIDKAKNTDELLTLLIELALFGNYFQGDTYLAEVRQRLAAFEKRYGIDMQKLEAEALDELKSEALPKCKAKAVKGTCRVCGCKENTPCDVRIEGKGERKYACSWVKYDGPAETLCNNPDCMQAAKDAGHKVQTSTPAKKAAPAKKANAKASKKRGRK